MELREVIEKRVSTRKYNNSKIDKKTIEDLIDCARLAPSAANRQPWYFIILEEKSKQHISDILLKKYQKGKKAFDNLKKDQEYNPALSLINSARIISEASTLILVYSNNDSEWLESDYLSIGCALEHICLRATDLELGSLWIRDVIYAEDEISKFVKREGMKLVTGLVIGYSIEESHKRKKKDLKDILEWFDDENVNI